MRAWRICSAFIAGGRAQALPVGARGGQALVGAVDDQLADELRERGEHVEHRQPAGVVVSSACCRSEISKLCRIRHITDSHFETPTRVLRP